MRWACLLLAAAMLAAPGCYIYGFRGQQRLLIGRGAPWEDIVLIRQGRDARARREAMVRLVRFSTDLKGDHWERYNGRVQIAYSTSEIHEKEPHVRAMAAALLRQVGTYAEAPMLVRGLEGAPRLELEPERVAYVRRELVKTLGVIGTPREAPALERVLHSHSEAPDTRVEAAYALARIGGRGAVDALVPGLRDRNESVVFAAWDGLRLLTGVDLPPAETDWRRWWDENRERMEDKDLAVAKEL